jgi:Flp pilus assembly pilin Flp
MSDILLGAWVRGQLAYYALRDREEGQTTSEYAILLGFLAVAIIVALFFLRHQIKGLFSKAASSISQAPAGS